MVTHKLNMIVATNHKIIIKAYLHLQGLLSLRPGRIWSWNRRQAKSFFHLGPLKLAWNNLCASPVQKFHNVKVHIIFKLKGIKKKLNSEI